MRTFEKRISNVRRRISVNGRGIQRTMRRSCTDKTISIRPVQGLSQFSPKEAGFDSAFFFWGIEIPRSFMISSCFLISLKLSQPPTASANSLFALICSKGNIFTLLWGVAMQISFKKFAKCLPEAVVTLIPRKSTPKTKHRPAPSGNSV